MPRERRADEDTARDRITVRDVLHPVGPLPAAVYWRRRLLVLTLLVSLFGGGGWLGVELVAGRDGDLATAAGSSPLPVPRLELVVPSPAAERTAEAGQTEPDGAADDGATETAAEPPAEPAPAAGGPCTDDMITLEVRTPGQAAPGSKPSFELVVTNVAAVPCVRPLNKELQEFVLVDGSGNRVWGSNDCFPETSSDLRTLEPGVAVSVSVVWGGLTSEPTCTAERTPPPAGDYLVRGRLDTKVSPDAPLVLG